MENLTKPQLLKKCKELGIKQYSGKNKKQLLELLIATTTAPITPIADTITPITPPPTITTPITDTITPVITPIADTITPITPTITTTTPLNAPTVIDLFCGCGGMSKGLVDAGLNVIAGIDIWDKAVASYNENYHDHHKAYCHDLTKLSPEKFNELYNKQNVAIDVIVGGIPCQSFSISGRRDTNDPRDDLFREYVKYLDYFRPKLFMIENVIGILSKRTEGGDKVIDIIMEQLNRNYNCIVMKLYASDFGVPQNRRRVIIIGVRKDLPITPTEPPLLITEIEKRVSVKTVLLPKDEIEPSAFLSARAINGIQNKKERSLERGAGFGAQFLDIDKPCYTIPARYWKDGYDALVKYSDTDMRRLTITELKRIQSFPDDYVLLGTKREIITQIGNAVACKFAYHLGKHIVGLLGDTTTTTA